VTVYGEVSEWLTKCEGILDAQRAISQRQEASSSLSRSNEHAVLLTS